MFFTKLVSERVFTKLVIQHVVFTRMVRKHAVLDKLKQHGERTFSVLMKSSVA